MTFEIVWTPKAKKQFSRLDKTIQKQIHEKLETIKDDAFSHEKTEFDILKLKIGDHTILSSVIKNSIVVFGVKGRSYAHTQKPSSNSTS